MAKPMIHAAQSAKKYGGVREDYIEIHDFMDSSKAVFGDNRHRALTHNSWFIFIVERVFGHTLINSDDREVHVRDICEQHISEDFGGKYIPTAADYLEHMDFMPWMNNGIEGCPSSQKKLHKRQVPVRRKTMLLD